MHLWNTWIHNESSQIEKVDFGSKIYYFFPFCSFCEWYVYASVWDFVCIALLSTFVLGLCTSVYFILFVFTLKLFFFFLNNYFLFFYFNNFILFYLTLFYFFSSFFIVLFFLPFILTVWMKGSWCSSQASSLCLWGGRANFRTLVHKRPPSST